MPNYQNGKIYALRSHQTEQVYIGSTTQTLAQRMCGHKSDNKRGRGCTSSILFQYDDVYIELVELYPCDTRLELHRREAEIIKSTPNRLNRNTAGRQPGEYKREYQTTNRDKILEERRAKYIADRDENLERAKGYYLANRDMILQRKHEARQAAKLSQQSEMVSVCTV